MTTFKFVALLIVAIVLCTFAAAPTATAYAGAGDALPPESCETQISYFTNCLARDEIRDQCCSVVADRKCLCKLEREVAVPCHPHRHRGPRCTRNNGAPPVKVKLSELHGLKCFQELKCY